MITAYGRSDGRIQKIDHEHLASLPPQDVTWVDLLNPTTAEEHSVEHLLGFGVPTREEMAEIEESSRLYREGDAVVMTAIVIDGAAQERPSRTQVTFVLTASQLVCIRYADPLPFKLFQSKCQQHPEEHTTAPDILASLLGSIVERAADILETTAADLYGISARLFFNSDTKRRATRVEGELSTLIERLGRKNMTVAILRESLLSIARLIAFAKERAPVAFSNAVTARLKQIDKDARSLSQYEQQLTAEIAYLHDATLGLINLEQNGIIKVFSIAAVLFLPPTLVGTVYGMNFRHMPELEWVLGYPFGLGLMILSGILPYCFFKWRGWL
jgi:magnesium transporter